MNGPPIGSDARAFPEAVDPATDRAYDTFADPRAGDDLARLRALSAAARNRLPLRAGLRYGADEAETFDLFPRDTDTPAPAVVFVHGGQWHLNTTAETSFLAPMLGRLGFATVGLNYPKVPQASLPEMAASVARGLAFVRREAAALRVDPRRLVLAGHSSGAHLAALACRPAPGAPTQDASPPAAGLLLISGIYDLVPLLATRRNAVLALDRAAARAASPTRSQDGAAGPGAAWPPSLIVVGAAESAAFRAQAGAMRDAIAAAGAPAACHEMPGGRHFTTPLALGEPRGPAAGFLRSLAAPRPDPGPGG